MDYSLKTDCSWVRLEMDLFLQQAPKKQQSRKKMMCSHHNRSTFHLVHCEFIVSYPKSESVGTQGSFASKPTNRGLLPGEES